MITLDQIKQLSRVSETKIVLLVIDGLGGIPDPKTGKTELESASTPNLDNIAKDSICGLSTPVSPGITPGSGAGHLALFGYDPFKFDIGRGILEALGVDFELTENDIAARGNFCTIDNEGIITDRRAGRIGTDKCAELCQILNKIKLEDIELFVQPLREHRFLFVIRGKGLSEHISDTDPQRTGKTANKCLAAENKGEKTASIVNNFVDQAKELLANNHPANMLVFRGFSKKPYIPQINEVYKLNPAAVAVYPMYRGLARLVGMKVYNVDGGISEEFATVREYWNGHDFFFIHAKKTDSAGEDGDFDRKVRAIEEVDAIIPQLSDLKPDVLVITGDHSTPALLKAHSWHPVPFLLYSQWCRPDRVDRFSESACSIGGLGTFPAVNIISLAMANGLKLNKFGA
ncbi:2,3-bisphosphoglycerate-independent phosphoglycerate mutase [Chloroflexota bacterium]